MTPNCQQCGGVGVTGAVVCNHCGGTGEAPTPGADQAAALANDPRAIDGSRRGLPGLFEWRDDVLKFLKSIDTLPRRVATIDISTRADQAAAKADNVRAAQRAQQLIEWADTDSGYTISEEDYNLARAYLAQCQTANDGWEAFLESQGQLHEAEQRIKAQQQELAELRRALVDAKQEIIGMARAGTDKLIMAGVDVDPAEKTYGPAVSRIDAALARKETP